MGSVEFEVSERLKAYGIKRIAQIGELTLRAEYHDIPIVTKFDFDDFTASMKRLRKEAEKYITSNGVAPEKVIEDLVLHVTKVTSDYYEKIGGNGNGSAASGNSGGVAEVGTGDTVLKMATWPHKSSCNREDWRKDVLTKYNNLKTI